MQVTVTDFAKNQVVYSFSNCTADELDNRLHLFFTAQGYTYKGEKEGGKIFTKGNKVLRAILGAFWKYFKFLVTATKEGDNFSVVVKKDASGLMGGAIGIHQVNKEFARMSEEFKTYFQN
jgi:hypothetical protein